MIVNNGVLNAMYAFYTYGVALPTQTGYYVNILYFTAKPEEEKRAG